MIKGLNPILWENDKFLLLDQRVLPHEEIYRECKTLEDAYNFIQVMVVRGAPCIGFTAILGMAMWARSQSKFSRSSLDQACDYLISSRPTAVNLRYEVNRCRNLGYQTLATTDSGAELFKVYLDFGLKQIDLSEEAHTKMANFAEKEIEKHWKKDKYNILTHCNTGYLACGSLGTALGIIAHLHSKGKVNHVWVDETRPYLQGSRLTAYELSKLNIPYDIVVEGASSYLMKNNKVDFAIVGADRITRNGDTANKVGTSSVAIISHYYKVPFFVAAPSSSFDLGMKTGEEIEIELRVPEEILFYKGQQIAPEGATALNPSFDVTDAKHISRIFTEKGSINPAVQDDVPRVIES